MRLSLLYNASTIPARFLLSVGHRQNQPTLLDEDPLGCVLTEHEKRGDIDETSSPNSAVAWRSGSCPMRGEGARKAELSAARMAKRRAERMAKSMAARKAR